MSAVRRILVVDDEPGLRRLLSDFFTHLGYQVETASDGLEGFRQTSLHEYDLVTMDIRMPGVNGVESLRSISMVGSKPKILVLSGYLTDEIVEDCRAAGASAALQKPVDLNTLRRTVEELLGPAPGKPPAGS